MRRMDSAISHVGNTVENIAIANEMAWIDRGTARAASGRVSRNCATTNTVDASIAQEMNRVEPSRAITPPACTR
jgi:hypothetical protein